ncbi:MAG: endolytic transglycosylase MltG [Candidatus Saccharimonadales bacterium]
MKQRHLSVTKYASKRRARRWPQRVIILALAALVVVVGVTIAVRQTYFANLKPVDTTNHSVQSVLIEAGSSVEEIGRQLEEAGLIRSAWAFKLYVSSKEARSDLQAGTYSFYPAQSVSEIVSLLTHGKISTDLVTILPGQRLDQIRASLLAYGFAESEVDYALNPANHQGDPALVDKPSSANLEGYIYPESFQRTGTTSPGAIINQALDEMGKRLTPELRQAFAAHGLSTYQAIILASIVEKEAASQADRDRVAQVYLKRLRQGIRLEADPTAHYGARLDGAPLTVRYDSPYNTYLRDGLPPTPISNVSESSLKAVAYPANTDWLYFVAGDDGVTHFSKTLAEHEANTARYCTTACFAQ